MTLSDYKIFPTEALLLGECLGEYLRDAAKSDKPSPFLDFVRRRLLPILPALVEQKGLRGLDGIERVSPNSLLELLLIHLTNSLSVAGVDKLFGLDPAYHQLRRYIEALATLAESGSDTFVELGNGTLPHIERSVFLERVGNDDREAIQSTITDCARESGYLDLLETGQAFGRLISDCEQLGMVLGKRDLYNWKDPFALSEYLSEEELRALADMTLVQDSGVSHELLRQAARQVSLSYSLEFEYDEVEESDDWDQVHAHARDVLGALWLVFGECLGAVREMDMVARDEDASLPVPRAYRVTRDATRDEIRSALDEAERRLNDPSQRVSAEMIVSDLSRSIEAMAKRLWPQLFPTKNLPSVFGRRLLSGNELEKRFAGTARTLYLSYRKPGMHEMDTFRCSNLEARFFVSGIRCLLDLAGRIADQSDL